MDRPIMNPWAFDDPEAPSPPGLWGRLCRKGGRLARAMLTLALRRPFARRWVVEKSPLWQRIAVGVIYRLTVVVILGALIVAVMLTAATHPPAAAGGINSQIISIYYDPISFVSLDGTRLEGWLVPALDASRILTEKDRALRGKHPAVILVHDYRQSRHQMTPLIRPLHEAGFVVLALDLRGCGRSGSGPQTFGLREWMDVKAAASMLRQRSFVDADRIAIVGIGTGANAAARAALEDPDIHALVLQQPCVDFNAALGRYVLPSSLQYGWVEASFRWMFGTLYRTDVDQLGSGLRMLDQDHMLRLNGGLPYAAAARKEMVRFLKSHLKPSAGS